MRQYQYESSEEKLRSTCNYAYCYYGNWSLYLTGYFDWMSNDDDQVTRDRLKIIVRHATHDQDEVTLLLLLEQIVTIFRTRETI